MSARALLSLTLGPARQRPRHLFRPSCLQRPVLIHQRKFTWKAVLLPPAVYCGLFVALWTWKCMMMVVFQNKIIYMPGMPPNARRETIADYERQCFGVQWREEKILSTDGTKLALCVAEVVPDGPVQGDGPRVPVYILYFQGNASSIPPRLPDISSVLRALKKNSANSRYHFTMVCLSYRGYWTSKGRPSEKGINKDSEAALRWIAERCAREAQPVSPQPVLLFWGQSIGAGFATSLAVSPNFPKTLRLRSMILETPFLSIRAMLETLYPQKWLPYKHLWPFLRNHLDNWKALGVLAEQSRAVGVSPPRVFILEAGRDELVPCQQGEALFERCQELGVPVGKTVVPSAYHNEASYRAEGKKAITLEIETQVFEAVKEKKTISG